MSRRWCGRFESLQAVRKSTVQRSVCGRQRGGYDAFDVVVTCGKRLGRWLTTPRTTPWILFFVALVPRLLCVALAHPPGDYVTSDMWVYELRATHLLLGDLGPWDSFTPAGYPAFLAVLYSIAGRQLMLVGLVQALLGASVVALTYALAMEVGHRRTPASLAAVASPTRGGVPSVLDFGCVGDCLV